MKKYITKKEIAGLIVIIVVFIASAYLSQFYSQSLQGLIEGHELFGKFFYVLITIASVVAAPVNTLFLLPIATALWGPVTAALLSIVGWTIGGFFAYYIARRYGKPIVRRFVNLEKIDRIQHIIPKHNIFIWLVLARMTVSVDILSYALGLLLPIPYVTYTLATLIGVTPFAFIFAYSASLPPMYILFSVILAIIAMGLGFLWIQTALKNQVSKERS